MYNFDDKQILCHIVEGPTKTTIATAPGKGRVYMGIGSSDLVRSVATENYVRPAILAGKTKFSVAVRDVMQDLQRKGFPPSNYPQICTAIKTGKFLKENGIEIESVDGPPSGLSTTVVVHYRVANSQTLPNAQFSPTTNFDTKAVEEFPGETSEARAERLTEKLRGLLKDELAEFGGGEAFIRWIRSEEEIESE
jgi:hypothetical protein